MTVVRVEIRCCCVPAKLLGWVELPEELLRRTSVRLPLVREYTRHWYREPVGRIMKAPMEIWLEIAEIQQPDGRRYRAIQAHETDLHLLGKVRGFIRAK